MGTLVEIQDFLGVEMNDQPVLGIVRAESRTLLGVMVLEFERKVARIGS